jgi:uncharacterized damage-inducible protein DinB
VPEYDLAGILDDLNSGYDGDAWHGPPLRKVLDGVTAEVASSHPIPHSHSIWEIVVHLSSWDDVITRRIAEKRAIEAPDGGDFPPVIGSGTDAWSDALQELDYEHARLVETVSNLDAERLGETVAGKDYSLVHMLRGVMQHMAYHAGQIALIRKLVVAQGLSPSAS